MQAKARLWYTRRGSRIRGPFHSGLIQRYLVLGRLTEEDEVSVDKVMWAQISQMPEFTSLPRQSQVQDPTVRERLLAAKRWADERQGYDRRADHAVEPQTGGAERRGQADRRQRGGDPPPSRRSRTQPAALPRPRDSRLGIAVVLAIAGVFLGLTFTVGPPHARKGPDCGGPPAPKVNWANCHLQGRRLNGVDLHGANLRNADLTGMDLSGSNLAGADLAFAKLRLSDLRNSNLSAARLKGADLTRANLNGANLGRADLSYATLRQAVVTGANLNGALLVNAIWVDAAVCARGSVGACRTSSK